jgi:membrane protein implicated in regulation of membrane protease activity
MGIWLELGIFALVFIFAFWQMHDVRKAQEQTRQQRAREKAAQEALDREAAAQQETDATDKTS